MEEIEEKKFSEQIKKIEKKFYIHKNNFLKELDNTDITHYEILISNYNIIFQSDFDDLNKIIIAIQAYIKTVNYKKGLSIGKVVFGIIEFGVCLVATFLTDEIALPLLYSSYAALNELSVLLSGVDIAMLKDLDKKLKEYLNEAEITKKIILNEIKEINEMLKENEKAKPVYWTNELKYNDIKTENDEAAPAPFNDIK